MTGATVTLADHPATFSAPVLSGIRNELDRLLEYGLIPSGPLTILDPFAGVGTVFELSDYGQVYGVEMEEEWARQHSHIYVGDSRNLDHFFHEDSVDLVITSPCYGNRMADTYMPPESDTSYRHTYTISLGRKLSEGNAAAMQWGPDYCRLHSEVWEQVCHVMKPGGFLILNIKNHHRSVASMTRWQKQIADAFDMHEVDGAIEQPVIEWHQWVLSDIGFLFMGEHFLDEATGIGGSGPRPSKTCERLEVLYKPHPEQSHYAK